MNTVHALWCMCIVISHSLCHAVAEKEAWDVDDKTMGDQIKDCGPKIAEALRAQIKDKKIPNCGFMQQSCNALVDPPSDGISYRSYRLSLKCVATEKGGTPGSDISAKLLAVSGEDKKAAAEEFMLDNFCGTSTAKSDSVSSITVLSVEKIIEALDKAAKETPKKTPTKDDLKNLPSAIAEFLDGKGYFAGKDYVQVDCDTNAPSTKQRSHVLHVEITKQVEFRSISYDSKYSFLAASDGDLIALPGKMAYNFQQQGHKELRMLKILKAIDDMLCSESMNKKTFSSKAEASKAFKAALGSLAKI